MQLLTVHISDHVKYVLYTCQYIRRITDYYYEMNDLDLDMFRFFVNFCMVFVSQSFTYLGGSHWEEMLFKVGAILRTLSGIDEHSIDVR